MAVKIRLRRMGAKKAPFYRVVVADSRQWLTLQKSILMQRKLRSGLQTVHSQQIPLRTFLKKKAFFNLLDYKD